MNPILSPKGDRFQSSSPNEVLDALNLGRSRAIPPNKKISTACFGCKKRKTRCSGKVPCTQCVQRGTVHDCLIDSTTDLRRKGVSDRRIDELERDRVLLDDIVETLRNSTDVQIESLVHVIRTGVSRAELASHVHSLLQKDNRAIAVTSAEPVAVPVRKRSICSLNDILNPEPEHSARSRLPISPISNRSPDWDAQRLG